MQLSVNRYHISGENDYLSVDGVRAQGIPTTSARGTPPGDAPFNSVWSTGFTYEHNNLAGFKLSTLLFSQEYEALLGATNSQSFQDTTIAPNKTLYDQSRAVSSKLGAKLALTRDDLLEDTLKVTAGFDVLLDKNKQDLYLTKRTYVPEIEYTNYSEGFGMPDVGRALRDIDTEGVDLSRANNVKPVVTKNIEAGLRVQQGAVDFEASYFRSSAKLGDSVTLNSDDDFVSKREKTRVQGVEVRSGYKINEQHKVNLSYAHTEGKRDSNGDGKLDKKMTGLNIALDRVIASWSASWTEKVNTFVQGNYAFSRSFDDTGLGCVP